MAENLPDTNVGNIEYIRKADAINCIEHMTWYHVNKRGQLVDGATSDTGLYKAKDVYKGLHDIPAADVAPVVHARWENYSPITIKCSRCGHVIHDWRYSECKYCPNCGAKMDA